MSNAKTASERKRRSSQLIEQMSKVEIKIEKPTNVAKRFSQKYILEEQLGEGAHAIVRKASVINSTKDLVAVKICRSGDPEIVKTFIDTYKNARLLNHQFILKSNEIYVDEESETLYLIMEYSNFPSLDNVLKISK